MRIGATLQKELFSDNWAMVPKKIESFFSALDVVDVLAVGDMAKVDAPKTEPRIEGGIAVVDIRGVLLQRVPAWFEKWGIVATGYDDIRQKINSAMINPDVASIMLRVESPGGTVSGLHEAAEAIRLAAQSKPVVAHIHSIGASAAYWLAAQANEIYISHNSEVGSIGVYTVMQDLSAMAAGMGIKVIVIRSGELKGGADGEAISDKQIAAMQKIIDQLAVSFKRAVASGRRMAMDVVDALATGEVWLPGEAVELKLVDGVGDFSAATVAASTFFERKRAMAEQEKKAEAEALEKAKRESAEMERTRLAELRKIFANDLAFVLDAYDRGLTVDQAKAECFDRQAEAKRAVAEAASVVADAPVVEPEPEPEPEPELKAVVPNGAEPVKVEGTPVVAGDDLISIARKIASEEKIPIKKAMARAHALRPDLVEKIKSVVTKN